MKGFFSQMSSYVVLALTLSVLAAGYEGVLLPDVQLCRPRSLTLSVFAAGYEGVLLPDVQLCRPRSDLICVGCRI